MQAGDINSGDRSADPDRPHSGDFVPEEGTADLRPAAPDQAPSPRFRLPGLPVYALPLAGLLLVAGGIILLLQQMGSPFFSKPDACLLTLPAADGVFVLDRDLQLHKFREAPCEPGPLLRTGEADHNQAMAVPEFKEFLQQWRGATDQYPDLPGKLSEIRLSRTKDTVFISRNGRLRIEVAPRSRQWPHTLHAVLVAAEARGWKEGLIDLKNEDGLFIHEK